MYDALVVHLFGAPRVVRSGGPLQMSPSCSVLFAYLLLEGRDVSRSRLLELVTADGPSAGEQAARRRLNTTVWRLRRALAADGTDPEPVLATSARGLRIAADCRPWVDVRAFETGCSCPRPVREWKADDAVRVRRALDLYAAPFLEGRQDDWVVRERARLADVRTAALMRLARWHEQSDDLETAAACARDALAADSLLEGAHRMLIRLYRRLDLTELADRQTEVFRRTFLADLGFDPLLGEATRPVPLDQPRMDGFGELRSELARIEHELHRLVERLEVAQAGRSHRAD